MVGMGMVMMLVHLLQLPDTFGHAAHEFRCCEHQTSRRSDQLRPGNAARLTGVSQSQQRTREPQQGQSRGQQPATRQTRTGQRQRCAAEPIPARSAQEEGFAYRVSFFAQPRMGAEEAKINEKKKTHLAPSRAVCLALAFLAAPPPLRLEGARSPVPLACPPHAAPEAAMQHQEIAKRRGEKGAGRAGYGLLPPAAALIRKAARLVRARRRV